MTKGTRCKSSSSLSSRAAAAQNLDHHFPSPLVAQLSSCAPVLTGIKSASTLVLFKQDENSKRALRKKLAEFRTYAFLLFEDVKYSLFLIFQKERLLRVLSEQRIRKFLQDQGYNDFSLGAMLIRLKERFFAHKKIKSEFPHEIGLFLEYPYEDVCGFIAHNGKKEKYNGYFKVYSDVDRAKSIFSLYDQARKQFSIL